MIEEAQQIEGSTEALEQNIAAVTEGQIRFNEAAERFRDSSGQFVSGVEAQARVLQVYPRGCGGTSGRTPALI